jgi:hypothetical protein
MSSFHNHSCGRPSLTARVLQCVIDSDDSSAEVTLLDFVDPVQLDAITEANNFALAGTVSDSPYESVVIPLNKVLQIEFANSDCAYA